MTELNQIRIETVAQHEIAVKIKQEEMNNSDWMSSLGAIFNIISRTGSTLRISESEFNTTIKKLMR